jgi:hypothetical protein
MRLALFVGALLIAGCGRVDVDCKAGKVSIQGGFVTNPGNSSGIAAVLLSQCPKEPTGK